MPHLQNEISKIAEYTGLFQSTVEQNFGSQVFLKDSLLISDHAELISQLHGVETQKLRGCALIPANSNIARLSVPGRGFGVLTAEGVCPGIISPRSTKDELHILYLATDAVLPKTVANLTSLEDLPVALLQGAVGLQDREVGATHGSGGASTATEAGHALLGIRAVTSKKVSDSLTNGHITHEIAGSEKGLMPAFGRKEKDGTPGIFSLKNRPMEPDEIVVRSDSPVSVWLVDSPVYRAISLPQSEEMPATDVLFGLTLIAAEDQLELASPHTSGSEPINKLGSAILKQLARL